MNSQTLNNIKQMYDEEVEEAFSDWLLQKDDWIVNPGHTGKALTPPIKKLWNFIQEEIQKAEREVITGLLSNIADRIDNSTIHIVDRHTLPTEERIKWAATELLKGYAKEYLSQPTGGKK